MLLVRVLDSLSGAPLPNAEVTAIGRSALTDVHGQVRILWPTEGTLSIRARVTRARGRDTHEGGIR